MTRRFRFGFFITLVVLLITSIFVIITQVHDIPLLVAIPTLIAILIYEGLSELYRLFLYNRRHLIVRLRIIYYITLLIVTAIMIAFKFEIKKYDGFYNLFGFLSVISTVVLVLSFVFKYQIVNSFIFREFLPGDKTFKLQLKDLFDVSRYKGVTYEHLIKIADTTTRPADARNFVYYIRPLEYCNSKPSDHLTFKEKKRFIKAALTSRRQFDFFIRYDETLR